MPTFGIRLTKVSRDVTRRISLLGELRVAAELVEDPGGAALQHSSQRVKLAAVRHPDHQVFH